MTEEKHYMTASECLNRNIRIYYTMYGDNEDMFKVIGMHLDTHFINKKELKDKILKILNNKDYIELIKHKWSNGDTIEYEVYKNGIKEKILELLKEE